MKKIVYSFGMFVAATMTFASCAKEISPETTEEVTHVMTINVGKAVDSKTAVVEGEEGATYKWSANDKEYFHVYESTTDGAGNETKNAGIVTAVSYSEDMSTASLSVSFTSSAEGPYTYTVIYANALNTKGNPVIPASQSPLVDNFDPAADVLISKPIVSQTRLDALDMIMGRVATINKMTLKGLDAGEKISKVEFTLDKGLSASYVLGTGNYNTISKKLTMSYEPAAVASDGTFPVYFVSAPVKNAAIESVVVTTDKNVYTKSSSLNPNPFEDKSISFAVGTMKRFGMDMGGYGEAISTKTEYTLVKATSELIADANYIVVVSDANYAMSLYTGGNNHPVVEIQKETNSEDESVILIDNTITVESIVLSSAGSNWYMLNNVADNTYYGQYLICESGTKNRLKETDDTTNEFKEWTIDISNGIATITNANSVANRNTIWGNIATNQTPIINCYAANQTDANYHTISLYIDKSSAVPSLKTPTGLAAVSVENSVMVSWKAVANAESYEVTCAGQTKNVTETEATFSDVAVGTYEVSVVAKASGYKNSAAAVTSVIVGKPTTLDKPVIKTVREIANGFYAELESEVQYAKSYDWELYEGSVAEENLVGCGENSTVKFSITINETDFDITAFKPETTYYLVITAKAPAYTSSESDPASFKTAAEANDGSLEKPFTAAEAITAIDAGGVLTDKYVKGVITEVTSFNSSYGSITYNIESGEKTLMVYGGLDLGNAQFSSIDDLKINDVVLVCGTLKKFNSTYEFDKNNYLVTINGLSEISAGLKVSGQKTTFTVGDKFVFGGTVVQDWRGKDDVDVTASATFSGYDMNTAGTQTVTVTVGEETASYEITVKDAGAATDPASYEWDLTSASDDWTSDGCVVYFSQPYGIKKVNAYIINKSIADFTKATPSKISVSVKSLRNGATTSKLTVYLVNYDGEVVGEGKEIIPDNASDASKTTYKEVVFDSSLSGATGIMVKCTKFGKNVLINGVKYTVTY